MTQDLSGAGTTTTSSTTSSATKAGTANASVVVMGQGYVGLPLALAAADAGIDVTGFDISSDLTTRLSRAESHVDDVSDHDLARARRQGYSATSDPSVIADADVVVVCVPTPLDIDGGPDLGPVKAAADLISQHVRPGTLCVLESTTYPGTTEEVFAPRVCSSGLVAGKDIAIAYSPERVDPGNKSFQLSNTPKIVSGLTPACAARAVDFYRRFVTNVVTVSGTREAEMAKLLENTFRNVNIALVNELLRFCEKLDIDLWEAIDAAATKPFGFMAFRPGPGVGGHCIAVDPSYLSHRVKAKLGYPLRMVEVAEEINQAAPDYVVNRTIRLLNTHGKAVSGARILLLGVAYKANIADVRDSPASTVAAALESWGGHVVYHDPFVPAWRDEDTGTLRTSEPDLDAAVRAADVVVLLQAHDGYADRDLDQHGTPLLDTRGVLPRSLLVERL